jgi:hypothetical protein
VQLSAEPVVDLRRAAWGTLTPEAPWLARSLAVGRDGATQFVLSADAGGAQASQVQMSVYDKAGALAFRLVALAGRPAGSGVAYLPAGEYTVVFAAASQGQPAAALSFALDSAALSDPIGPVLVGTTPPPPAYDYYWGGPSYLAFDPVYSWIDPFYLY